MNSLKTQQLQDIFFIKHHDSFLPVKGSMERVKSLWQKTFSHEKIIIPSEHCLKYFATPHLICGLEYSDIFLLQVREFASIYAALLDRKGGIYEYHIIIVDNAARFSPLDKPIYNLAMTLEEEYGELHKAFDLPPYEYLNDSLIFDNLHC